MQILLILIINIFLALQAYGQIELPNIGTVPLISKGAHHWERMMIDVSQNVNYEPCKKNTLATANDIRLVEIYLIEHDSLSQHNPKLIEIIEYNEIGLINAVYLSNYMVKYAFKNDSCEYEWISIKSDTGSCMGVHDFFSFEISKGVLVEKRIKYEGRPGLAVEIIEEYFDGTIIRKTYQYNTLKLVSRYKEYKNDSLEYEYAYRYISNKS